MDGVIPAILILLQGFKIVPYPFKVGTVRRCRRMVKNLETEWRCITNELIVRNIYTLGNAAGFGGYRLTFAGHGA